VSRLNVWAQCARVAYTGPARVIRTEAELCELKPGEVLVCPTTHSSWTVAFSKVGALVADGGSILSHPSIIAREHGIPAVVATIPGTSSLCNGELVTSMATLVASRGRDPN
jgi:pyruvate,water dikinase